MASRREQILGALVTAIETPGGPAGLSVHRRRTRPMQQDALPAVVVYPLAEQTGSGDGPHGYKARRKLVVRCEVRASVASTSTTAIEAALDPILSWVVQRVMADRQQGRLAHNTTERATQWDAVEGDAVLGAASIDFEIDYVTAAGDPDA